MKRRLIVFLTILVGLLMVCATAVAATDPLKVSLQLSEDTLSGPQQISVSIQVANTGDTDLPGPVRLFDPDGNQIEEFGEPVLTAGTAKSWSGTWNVTQEQLEAGKITFSVKYTTLGDEGEVQGRERRFSRSLTYEGAVASIEVNRVITPTTAHNGQEVSVIYDVVNTGTMEVTNVEITEDKSISSSKGTIERIAAGEKATYTFTVKMAKKDLTSKPTISYTAGGKTEKITKEAATIKYGEIYLTGTLTSDIKGAEAGTTAKLTLTLKNTGKTDYTDINVTDAVLGEVFSGQRVAAGQTVTLEKDVVIEQTTDYMFTIQGTDGDGNAVETTTSMVTLTAVTSDQVVKLNVLATVDSEVVYELPSIVKFKVFVTNESAYELKNVTVRASGVTLYTFPTIESGETRDFTRDVQINMAGKYQFVASARDQLNQTQTFDSNIIQLYESAPTAAPTLVPIVAPQVPDFQDVPTQVDTDYEAPRSILSTASIVLLVLTIAAAALLIAALIRRAMVKAQANKAIETFDQSSVRDYTSKHGEDQMEDEEPIQRVIDQDADPSDLPSVDDVKEQQEDPDAQA